ncbi:MAG: exopolyphosphatase, partial [Myxococcota bacterium]
KHAAYVVRNAEMPGFSREQQTMLAAILENQRRRLRPKRFERLAPDRQELALQLSVIVRLSILLNRERTDEAQPSVEVTRASRRRLDLRFPEGWLDGRPMTRADLEEEASYLDKIDIELAFE